MTVFDACACRKFICRPECTPSMRLHVSGRARSLAPSPTERPRQSAALATPQSEAGSPQTKQLPPPMADNHKGKQAVAPKNSIRPDLRSEAESAHHCIRSAGQRSRAAGMDDPAVADPCAYRKLDPHVLVMQSAQDRPGKYVTNSLDGARNRRILVQGQARTRLIVVIEI